MVKLCFTNISTSQELLNIDTLNSSQLYLYYQRVETSQIEELKENQISPTLSLLPGIGTSAIYNPNTDRVQIFPSVSFSISQFIQAKRSKKYLEAKTSRIRQLATDEFQGDLKQAQNLYRAIQQVKMEITLLKEKLLIHRKIHAYDSTQFINNEINPDNYYRSQLTLLSAKQNVILARQKLQTLISEYNQILKL